MLGFAWVSGQLFFEQQTNNFMASVKDLFADETGTHDGLRNLSVIYAEEPISLEPAFYDPITRQRLNNIYEPLVKLDRDLNIRPSLAVSWGLIDDVTWEFRLRPNVYFHDGSKFDAEDVRASFDRAMSNPQSQLIGILESIKEIEILDDLMIRIRTDKPDPLLLQKLSSVLIFPAELKDEEVIQPIGTGSYQFTSWEPLDRLTMEKFLEYWGEPAKFDTVTLITEADKSVRVARFIDGEADLLDFVPFDGAEYVEEKGFKVTSIPSLEVQFLMFNTKSPIFKDMEKRKVFSLAIDNESLIKQLSESYVRNVSQFISNGIFGFNPDIPAHRYDIDEAKILAKNAGFEGQTITLHLPKALELLGEHVRTQLSKIGVNVLVSYMDMDKLVQSINAGDADVYFIGFKSDLGDASDFFNVLIHSKASFNVAKYSNEEVDKLIDRTLVEIDPSKRLLDLMEAMRIIVEEDVIGVPLFEYEKLFAFSDKLDLQPRIDGLIYFDELTVK